MPRLYWDNRRIEILKLSGHVCMKFNFQMCNGMRFSPRNRVAVVKLTTQIDKHPALEIGSGVII